MPELLYMLYLLIVMNFYLKIRKQNTLTSVEKLMVSLMSIFIVFALYYATAYFFGEKMQKMVSPIFNAVFMFTMAFILPIITTEIMLNLYILYRKK